MSKWYFLISNITDYKVKQKMECLANFTLYGNIMSMKFVKLPGSLRDSLLLSFSEAKVRPHLIGIWLITQNFYAE